MEEDRTPVGRLDFKSSEGRSTSLVGSTPTLFRQSPKSRNPYMKKAERGQCCKNICQWNLLTKRLTLARGPSLPMLSSVLIHQLIEGSQFGDLRL